MRFFAGDGRGGRGAVVFHWLRCWRVVVKGDFGSRSWDKAVRERVNRDGLGHWDTLKNVICVGHLVDDGLGEDGRLHRRLPGLRGFGAHSYGFGPFGGLTGLVLSIGQYGTVVSTDYCMYVFYAPHSRLDSSVYTVDIRRCNNTVCSKRRYSI